MSWWGFFDVYSGFSDRKTPEFEISDLIGPRTSNNEDSDKNKQKSLGRSDLFNSIWDSIKNFPKVVISDQLENFCQGIMGQTIEEKRVSPSISEWSYVFDLGHLKRQFFVYI